MGRPFKRQPTKKAQHASEAVAKRKARTIRRRFRGKKLRVVAGTAAARALGIQ